MASQLILDKKDPGIEAMVSGWVDNQEYDMGPSRVRQVKTVRDQVFLDVLSIEGGEAVLDDTGPPAKPPPTPKQSIPISYRK